MVRLLDSSVEALALHTAKAILVGSIVLLGSFPTHAEDPVTEGPLFLNTRSLEIPFRQIERLLVGLSPGGDAGRLGAAASGASTTGLARD